jgi:hypothetical protein
MHLLIIAIQTILEPPDLILLISLFPDGVLQVCLQLLYPALQVSYLLR